MLLHANRITNTVVVLLITLVLSACIAANKQINRVTLFNGENLEGWRQAGAEIWRIDEGQITVSDSEADGYLVSRQKFADFKLSLEFWADDRVNSGIFIRCAEGDEFTPFNCYEMNIWDKHPKQEFRTGSIVTLVSPPLAHVETINKWNTYEITAVGNEFQVKVNGTLTAVLTDDKHSSGFIALQRANNGKVRFRNIIMELL